MYSGAGGVVSSMGNDVGDGVGNGVGDGVGDGVGVLVGDGVGGRVGQVRSKHGSLCAGFQAPSSSHSCTDADIILSPLFSFADYHICE